MILNGKWVDEYNQNNWSFGPGGGQGLFNPGQQNVYWNQGTPSYQDPNKVLTDPITGKRTLAGVGATAPGWVTGGYGGNTGGTTPAPGGGAGIPPGGTPNNGANRPLGPAFSLNNGQTGSGNPGQPIPQGLFGGNSNMPTTGGNLTGANPYNYNSAYGGIPQVPNPIGSAGDVINGNIGNLGLLYKLAQGAGGASGAGALANLLQGLPGADKSLQAGLGNTNSLLGGVIPNDVKRNLMQGIAERGVQTGTGANSPNNNAAMLRALGLTSFGLQQTGLSNLGSLIGMTPQGPQFNPSSMLVNPQDQQMWQWLANQLQAAPVPSSAAAANLAALRNGIGRGTGATGPGNLSLGYGSPSTGGGALGFGGGAGLAPSRNAPYSGGYASGGLPTTDDLKWMGWGDNSGNYTDYGLGGYNPENPTGTGGYMPPANASDSDYWNFSGYYGGDNYYDPGSYDTGGDFYGGYNPENPYD